MSQQVKRLKLKAASLIQECAACLALSILLSLGLSKICHVNFTLDISRNALA